MGLLKELVLATVKSNVRERQAFFWILILPLMIYIIFGVYKAKTSLKSPCIYLTPPRRRGSPNGLDGTTSRRKWWRG